MARDSVQMETAYRNASIICGAMAAGTLVYAIVVAVISALLAPFEGFAPAAPLSALRTTLWTMAMVEAGLIGLARRTLLARPRAEGAAAQARRLVTTAVATAALAEGPAILGLALFMLSGLQGDCYALLALSLALQAIYFPRLEGWREWAGNPAPGS